MNQNSAPEEPTGLPVAAEPPEDQVQGMATPEDLDDSEATETEEEAV